MDKYQNKYRIPSARELFRGVIARRENRAGLYVVLDEFIVMPNHIHGILEIRKSVETPYMASHKTHRPAVPREQNKTRCIASLQNTGESNQFGPQSQPVASRSK